MELSKKIIIILLSLTLILLCIHLVILYPKLEEFKISQTDIINLLTQADVCDTNQ